MSFDRGNEEYNKAQMKDPGRSLLKTLGSSLIIASLISALGTFYVLFRKENPGLTLWLSFMIPYGGFALASIGEGSVCLFSKLKKPFLAMIGCVLGAILAVSGIVNGVFLSNWAIAISISVIGACVFAIGFLSYSELKNPSR